MGKSSIKNQWFRDVRVRFFTAFFWLIGLAVMNHAETIGFAGLLILLMAFLYRFQFNRLLTKLLCLFPFFLVTFITFLFSDGFPLSREAFESAVLILTRILVSSVILIIVVNGGLRENLAGLKGMKFPDSFISIVFFTERYITLMSRQFSKVRQTLLSRLFCPRLKWRTLKIYGQIIGGMTIKAIDRSEQIQKAMMSRGFQKKIPCETPRIRFGHELVKSILCILPLVCLLLIDFFYLNFK